MKRLAWRLLSCCLLAVLSGCTGAATPPSHSTSAVTTATPNVVAVVTGYYRAIVIQNYRHAFGYLAPAATGPDGSKLTLSSFLQLARMLDGMGGPVTRFSIGAYPPEVVMTLYRAKYGPYHAHLRMVWTGHGWAIGSIDRI
jgi:hypothetical protein